jgi:hypothetical protein
VRARLDWKYLLGLELTDPGFDHSVLSEFRARLLEGQAEQRLLDTLRQRLQEMPLLKARGRQRTDSTHVLAAVRTLNRLERVGETLRASLNALATVAPEWLSTIAPSAWYERYGRRIENDRLPAGQPERERLANTIGADGPVVLQAIADAPAAYAWLAELPIVNTLRQVWDGPVPDDCSWQARANQGFDKAHFRIDWEARTVTCPAGCRSHTWLEKTGVPNMVAEARFSPQDGTPCPHRTDCTKSKKASRVIAIQERERYEALQEARRRQSEDTFREEYAVRAGVEGTHEQAVRRCGLRRCRYLGLAKTRLPHVATAVAINLIRLGDWLTGTPLAPTRQSRFAALQMAA